MKILITGAGGLVGTALTLHLTRKKHRVIHLVRKASAGPNEICWDPQAKTIEKEALEGIDAVIHLAGENIATGRWTAQKKLRIRESRVQGTHFLSRSLSQLFDPPKVLVSVSAVGYYGDRGADMLDEESEPGRGFLADVCREWESAAAPALMRGIRVVHPRLGMVLSSQGGVLDRILPVFRLGAGGRIGSGRQYMSWIAMEDVLEILEFAVNNASLHGPINAVSPNPMTNQDFTIVLGRLLGKPTFLSLPAFAARTLFGEMADALLLASARVFPTRLKEAGFQFKFPDLEDALRHLLLPGKP